MGDPHFHTCGSDFGTTLGAYTGRTVNALTTLGSDDDRCGMFGGGSEISFPVTTGTTYRNAVDGFNTNSGDIVDSWVKLRRVLARFCSIAEMVYLISEVTGRMGNSQSPTTTWAATTSTSGATAPPVNAASSPNSKPWATPSPSDPQP